MYKGKFPPDDFAPMARCRGPREDANGVKPSLY